jgi:pimeloyl-ACP methyl ester carboxylesterase
VRSFAPDYQTVSVSVRGHGRSGAQFSLDRSTMTVLDDDLLSLLRQLGVGRANWVGNSLGGPGLMFRLLLDPVDCSKMFRPDLTGVLLVLRVPA